MEVGGRNLQAGAFLQRRSPRPLIRSFKKNQHHHQLLCHQCASLVGGSGFLDNPAPLCEISPFLWKGSSRAARRRRKRARDKIRVTISQA